MPGLDPVARGVRGWRRPAAAAATTSRRGRGPRLWPRYSCRSAWASSSASTRSCPAGSAAAPARPTLIVTDFRSRCRSSSGSASPRWRWCSVSRCARSNSARPSRPRMRRWLPCPLMRSAGRSERPGRLAAPPGGAPPGGAPPARAPVRDLHGADPALLFQRIDAGGSPPSHRKETLHQPSQVDFAVVRDGRRATYLPLAALASSSVTRPSWSMSASSNLRASFGLAATSSRVTTPSPLLSILPNAPPLAPPRWVLA